MIRPEPRAAHGPGRRFAHFIKTGQVDGEDPVPLVARELVECDTVNQRVDTRVVHEHVEVAVLGDDLVDDRLDFKRLGHIELKSTRARGPGGCFAGSWLIDVGVDDGAAICGQAVGNRLPDTASGARDQAHHSG